MAQMLLQLSDGSFKTSMVNMLNMPVEKTHNMHTLGISAEEEKKNSRQEERKNNLRGLSVMWIKPVNLKEVYSNPNRGWWDGSADKGALLPSLTWNWSPDPTWWKVRTDSTLVLWPIVMATPGCQTDCICNELQSRNGGHTCDPDLEARRQPAFGPDLEAGSTPLIWATPSAGEPM